MRFFRKDHDLDIIEVSDKHVKLRTVLFVISFAVAVATITLGVTRMGHKDPGFYVISGQADEEAMTYQSGVTFSCYFDGKSGEIKDGIKRAGEVYTGSLSTAYKLLDAKKQYNGIVNLAYVNAHLGEEIALPKELYEILVDAWEKTREEAGYSMFAGALSGEWEEIRMLTEPEEYDPLLNADEEERIRKLREATADQSNFDVRIVDEAEHKLMIRVDDDYTELLEQLESDRPVLDLNILRDAYEMELVKTQLEAEGFTRGALLTDSGLTVNLSAQDQGEFGLYTLKNGVVTLKETVPAGAGSVCSFFHCFALEKEPGYYVLRAGDTDIYRSPFMPLLAEDPELVLASWSISRKGKMAGAYGIAETVYANVKLWASEDPSGIAAEYTADPVLRWDGRQDG